MYAPFRLQPLESSEVLTFEKDFCLTDGDLEELAPQLIMIRFEGKRETLDEKGLKSYTFHFYGKFAIGNDRDHLQFCAHSLEGEDLIIPDKVYTFSTPAYISGNQAQTGETEAQTLLPHPRFHFLDLTYTLIHLECVSEDIFDGIYMAEKY